MKTPTVLDVVLPVHNEQAVLAASVHRLTDHLAATFPYPFRITIADNASTDQTWLAASQLARQLPEVRAVHLPEKGRGRALKTVWSQSDAPILAYMDVDLSTDLDTLWPLLAPLMSGHSDLAIGSRLARGSRVVRGPKREVISRAYNLLLRGVLGARFSDAQCGFKAIRSDVAAELLPLVEDTSWFFDTEVLVLTERCSLRIHEVPVDWYDDPDSRVDIVSTARDDLRGILRLRRSLWHGELPVAQIGRRIGRGGRRTQTGSQIWRFAGVGAVSTLVHLGLFALFAGVLASAQVANTIALVLATMFNTAANRRWTFAVRGRRHAVRHQLQGLGLFVLTWAMSGLSLGLLHLVSPAAGSVLQTAAVGFANAATAVLRFVALRRWIGAPAPQPRTSPMPDTLAHATGPLVSTAEDQGVWRGPRQA